MVRPIQIVILGASGDLTARKLVPALLSNYARARARARHRAQVSGAGAGAGTGASPAAEGAFERPIQVIGVSRTEKTSETWRTELGEWIPAELREAWQEFAPNLHWLRADAATPEGIAILQRELGDHVEHLPGGCRHRSGRLFYLALAPALFGPVVAALSAAGLLACEPGHDEGWRRVVIEKPFGTDLPSAAALNRVLLTHLREDQIFRIDHYLGKETVQNILTLRFQNAIFEPLWNRKHIESVEISVCETVAMEGRRGAYYDTAGALRDMVQNHLLQILALVAMEPPGSLQADAIRNEKVKVLQSLRPFTGSRVGQDVVRGQYTGYRDAHGVAPGSTTETYVAIRAMVDNWRWSGVPFLLRTGKALHQRFTEVTLRFRTPPIDLLNGPTPDDVCPLRPNDLRLQIQPNEGLQLGFLVKQPGPGMIMRHAELGFDYHQLGDGATPEAYQRLLLDAINGQATLFIRGDEVEAAWAFVDGIRAGWAQAEPPLHSYAVGSAGPEAADELFHGCEGTWSPGP